MIVLRSGGDALLVQGKTEQEHQAELTSKGSMAFTVGQAFQPDVSLERLTDANVPAAPAERLTDADAVSSGAALGHGSDHLAFSGRAKTNRVLPRRALRNHGAPSPAKPAVQPPQPTHTAMYCLPSRLYVIGPEWCPDPHWKLQSTLPVL